MTFHFLLPTSSLFGPQSDISTMRTDFVYDCISSFVHSCALGASRSTGEERDTESGLDYFGARYFGSHRFAPYSVDGWRLQL